MQYLSILCTKSSSCTLEKYPPSMRRTLVKLLTDLHGNNNKMANLCTKQEHVSLDTCCKVFTKLQGLVLNQVVNRLTAEASACSGMSGRPGPASPTQPSASPHHPPSVDIDYTLGYQNYCTGQFKMAAKLQNCEG